MLNIVSIQILFQLRKKFLFKYGRSKPYDLMKILFNAKRVYQKNIHNSSLPRLIRFIYVNVFCQRAGINFGRVALLFNLKRNEDVK